MQTMNAASQYDGTLQMFVEQGREVDTRHLQFLRWLAERGKLEHGVAGPASGAMASGKQDRIPSPSGRSLPGPVL
jgi:hypothetical protein